MKPLMTALAGAAALVSFAIAAPQVGETAPDFTGETSTGETISLSDFAGQMVILEWTNDGCPFVQKHYNSGNMQSLQRRVTAEDIVWVSIISSAPGEQGYATADEANALTEDRNAHPSYVVLDPSGEIGQLYSAQTTPHMFVIDSEQTLQYAGAIDSIPTANPGRHCECGQLRLSGGDGATKWSSHCDTPDPTLWLRGEIRAMIRVDFHR